MFFSFKLLQFILKSRGLDGWKFSANDGLGMLFIILAYLETNHYHVSKTQRLVTA